MRSVATFLPVLQSFPPSEHQPSRSGNSADSPSVTIQWELVGFFLLLLYFIWGVVRGLFNEFYKGFNSQLSTTMYSLLKPDHFNLTLAS